MLSSFQQVASWFLPLSGPGKERSWPPLVGPPRRTARAQPNLRTIYDGVQSEVTTAMQTDQHLAVQCSGLRQYRWLGLWVSSVAIEAGTISKTTARRRPFDGLSVTAARVGVVGPACGGRPGVFRLGRTAQVCARGCRQRRARDYGRGCATPTSPACYQYSPGGALREAGRCSTIVLGARRGRSATIMARSNETTAGGGAMSSG